MTDSACQSVSGTIMGKLSTRWLSVTENEYPSGTFLESHTHEHSYFTIVAEGSYSQFQLGNTLNLPPGTANFLPAHTEHKNRIGSRVRCLQIAIHAPLDFYGRELSGCLNEPTALCGPRDRWLAQDVMREFAVRDRYAGLAIDALILELLVGTVRENEKKGSPAWLRAALEVIEASNGQPITIANIAAQVEIHPVRLSRQFRKSYGCTIASHMRRRRVDKATDLLLHSKASLSEIALMCGFSDQSDLCRCFKSVTGWSPARFRQSVAGLSGQQYRWRNERLRNGK